MRDIVAIVGSHPVSRAWFDFTRKDCDVWVFNEAPKNDWCGRYDAVFQMHSPVIWRSEQNRNDPEHYQWLKDQRDTQIIMQDEYEEIPCSVKFPLAEVCDKLLGDRFDRKYFTSSVSFAIALAIYYGYKTIELYGVEMETNTEYKHQRDGVSFWIGLGIGFGAEIKLFSHNLMISPVYGYEGDIKLPLEYFQERIAELTPICNKQELAYKTLEQSTNKTISIFMANGLNPENVIQGVQQQVAAGHHFGVADGARQENERYIKKMQKMLDESGDYTIVMQEYEQAYAALMKKTNEQMALVNRIATELESTFRGAQAGKNRTRRRTRMQKFSAVHMKYIQESVKVGIFQGAASENKRYIDQLELKIRMAGGEKSKVIMEEALVAA